MHAAPTSPNTMSRRGPTLGYSRPATWDETSTPMACGKVVSPDWSAVRPRRSWRKSGMMNSTPAKLEYESNEARLALRNMRSAKSRRASIGCGWRSSTHGEQREGDDAGDGRRRARPASASP